MLISPSDVFPDFILEQFGQFFLTILGTCNFRVFQIVVRGVGGGGEMFPLSQWEELGILLEDCFHWVVGTCRGVILMANLFQS